MTAPMTPPASAADIFRAVLPSDRVSVDDKARRIAASDIALRGKLIAAMDAANAGHFQIGRTYAAHPGVPQDAAASWPALKKKFDPDRIMNPDALGL